jgi:hypothetical protein
VGASDHAEITDREVQCDTTYSSEPTLKTPETSVKMVGWVLVWYMLLVGCVMPWVLDTCRLAL